MTDLRKAAEQALEALEKQHNWMVANDGMFQIPSRKAIQALRQALAQPVDAVNMSQERVDETAKDRLVRIMGTFDLATGHADTLDQALDALEEELRDVLGHLRARREWVGLDGEIPGLGLVTEEFYNGMLFAEDYLREKNGG